MGPHQGMQVLIDLPQAQAKAGMRHSMVSTPTSVPLLREQNGSSASKSHYNRFTTYGLERETNLKGIGIEFIC